jgi:hypothetical protein
MQFVAKKRAEAGGAAARASDAGCKSKAPQCRVPWTRNTMSGSGSPTLAVRMGRDELGAGVQSGRRRGPGDGQAT